MFLAGKSPILIEWQYLVIIAIFSEVEEQVLSYGELGGEAKVSPCKTHILSSLSLLFGNPNTYA